MEITKQIEYLKRVVAKDESLAYDELVMRAMRSNKSVNYIKRQKKIDNPLEYMDSKKLNINPNASQQMRGLWKSLGLESDVLTNAKEESFATPILKALVKTTPDDSTREIIQQVLDISSTKNLLSQYIPAYEMNHTGDGFCFQSCRSPGTSSYRISGKTEASGTGISMVTQPGITKKAVVAPKGFIIATSDYAGLEGVIGANLTHDPNKIKIFNEGMDLHCLNAASFFKPQVEELLGRKVEQTLEFNRFFNKFRKSNKKADALRAKAKSPNYLMEYGGYPPKLSKDLGCPLQEAEAIWNTFHYEIFLGTTKYREEYILPTAQKQGYIHLGLGAKISTKNAQKDIRTITNSTYQFWSILTLISIVKLKKRIKEMGYENDIFIYSTIHDSVTAYIREDAKIIKWYNDNLIDCMIPDFIYNQEVKLDSNVDIGYSYDQCTELPNNCSEEHIEGVLEKLRQESKS